MQKLLARRSSSTGVILFQAILFMHATSWAAEGIIYKAPAAGGTYCHLKFPAISEDTLFSDRPVLKSPSEGDIRDFYGPCDYDPLSKEEVLRQRRELERERRRRYGND